MRNKIKQMMNKEEGFTLVELLAVIVILGIIVAIAIPAVGGVINRAGDDAQAAEESLVLDAARLYFVQNPDKEEVTVGILVTEDYIDERSDSDLFDSTISDTSSVKIVKTDSGGAVFDD